jgi:TonB family protein
MIASWMLYSCFVSAVLCVGALALARGAAARGRPSRWIWTAAIVLSALWPVASAARRLLPARDTALPFAIVVPTTTIVASATDAPAWPAPLDRGLTALWIVASALLLLRIAQATMRLAKTRREWRSSRVDGCDVQLTPNVGPAVIGVRAMDVVLPEWILDLDTPLRALVLCHENEHRAARDPLLLLVSALAAALMPWNPALWWQSRRLRLAIEMDCDARVLRTHPVAERYGLLMLTIAQRRSAMQPMFAPMLTEPVTQLERRIRALGAKPGRFAKMALVGGAIIGAAALAVACSLQSDTGTAPVPSNNVAAARAQTANAGNHYTEFSIDRQATPLPGTVPPSYPEMLRSAHLAGDVVAQFVVDESGQPEMSTLKIVASTHDLFAASVKTAIAQMRFSPAEIHSHAVKQLVRMPFHFSIAGDVSTPVAASDTSSRSVYVTSIAPPGPARHAITGTAPPRRPMRDSATYYEYQVEQTVQPYPDNKPPVYPSLLRSAKVEGTVLVQFVLDTTGYANMATLKIVKSSHDLFASAVKEALPTMRFHPALVGGHPVKQFVQMPFEFSLNR